MSQIYEGMFLLDNDLVRAGWDQAKAQVTDLIAKHGGSVHTARHWAERKLAYPIKRRTRATYLLVHYEIPAEGIPTFVRDLDLSETILRYLLLCADEVPAEEKRLHEGETTTEFAVDTPPSDEVGSYEPLQGPKSEEPEEAEKPAEAEGEAKAAEPKPAAEPVAVASEATTEDTEKGEDS